MIESCDKLTISFLITGSVQNTLVYCGEMTRPEMCDFSDDGRLKSFLEWQMLAAEQPLLEHVIRPIREPVRTYITVQITPAGLLSSS